MTDSELSTPEWRRAYRAAYDDFQCMMLDDEDTHDREFFASAARRAEHEHTDPCPQCARFVEVMTALAAKDREWNKTRWGRKP